MTFDPVRALRLAHETFDIEAAAVLGLKARTGEAFARAVKMILGVRGRVVVRGMGKSGHIGRKLAALACTIVFSATCVLSAILPAQSGANSLVAEMAARPQA